MKKSKLWFVGSLIAVVSFYLVFFDTESDSRRSNTELSAKPSKVRFKSRNDQAQPSPPLSDGETDVLQMRRHLGGLGRGDDFLSAWTAIEEGFPNRRERHLLLTSLVSKMGLLGKTDEAVSLIKSKSGFGKFQESLIGAAFSSAPVQSSSDYLALIERSGIKDERNRAAALTRIGMRLGIDGLDSNQLIAFSQIEEDQRSVFYANYFLTRVNAHLRGSGSASDNFSEVVGKITELSAESLIEDSLSEKVILDSFSVSPFERAEALNQIGIDVTNVDRGDKLIREMVKESPEKTMEFLIGKDSKRLTSAAMDYWVTQDPFEAQGWVSRNRQILNANFYQQIVPSFVRTSIENGEFDTGRKWVAEISDRETRESLLTSILKEEK